MEIGFRPKIWCVEYNSAYGPTQSMTIEYDPEFNVERAHPSRLYYGVSLAAWKRFFSRYGYTFVTVERNGVNAFFVDPQAVDVTFMQDLRRIDFCENYAQRMWHKGDYTEQFKVIGHMPHQLIE